MKEKMIPAFRKAEGGLFTAVEKALPLRKEETQ